MLQLAEHQFLGCRIKTLLNDDIINKAHARKDRNGKGGHKHILGSHGRAQGYAHSLSVPVCGSAKVSRVRAHATKSVVHNCFGTAVPAITNRIAFGQTQLVPFDQTVFVPDF